MDSLKAKAIKALRFTERYTKTDMVYLASGAFWGNLNFFVYSLLSLAASILFARLLSKDTFGTYQYILSIAGLIGATTLTGMNNAVTRAVAQGHEGELRRSVRYQIVMGIIPACLSIAVFIWYFAHGNRALAIPFLFIAAFLPLNNAFNTWAAYTGGKKLFRIGTYYGFINTLITYIGLISFVYFTRNFIWIAFANFFFGMIGSIVAYKLVIKNIPPNDTKDTETISYGKHLSFMALPGAITSQLDAILIFHFIGPAMLAIYSFATLLPEKLAGALKFFSNIALPKFSEKGESHVREFIFKRIGLMMLFTAFASGVYVLFAPWIFHLFFPAYTSSVIYTQVYSLSLFSMVSTFIQTALTSQKKTKELYILNTAMPIAKSILLVALMFFFGVWGVIWAQIIAIFISIPLQLFLFKNSPSSQPIQ